MLTKRILLQRLKEIEFKESSSYKTSYDLYSYKGKMVFVDTFHVDLGTECINQPGRYLEYNFRYKYLSLRLL